jgi:hypothetical protein
MTAPKNEPTKPLSGLEAAAVGRNVSLTALAFPLGAMLAAMIASYKAIGAVAGAVSNVVIDKDLSKSLGENILSQFVDAGGEKLYEMSTKNVVRTLNHAAQAGGNRIPVEYIENNWMSFLSQSEVPAFVTKTASSSNTNQDDDLMRAAPDAATIRAQDGDGR